MNALVQSLRLYRQRSDEIEGRPSRAEVEAAFRTIIRWTGDYPDRDGLLETPARVTRAFGEYFYGYDQNPEQVLSKTFEETNGYDEMMMLGGWSSVKDTTPAEVELLQTIANAAALAIPFVELQRQYAANAEQSLVRDGDAGAIWDRDNLLTISGHAFALGFDLAHAMARALDGRIYYWSSNMECLYGWSRDEAVGQVSHELLKTHFPVPLQQIEGELLETGEWNGELTHSTRDGREIVVASHWALLRAEAGTPVSVIEVNNDITALKATENALRRAKEEAEANAKAKSRLLATVGHDLKQPLHVIRMVLSGLDGKLGAPQQRDLLARADRSSEFIASATVLHRWGRWASPLGVEGRDRSITQRVQ